MSQDTAVPKLCECGCGQSTSLAETGEYRRFLAGHNTRVDNPRASVVGEGPNPGGWCQCGCGQKAPLARQGKAARGYVKGKPVRFILGHSARVQDRVSGERHHNWKGGGGSYRDRALRAYGAICAECGYDSYCELLWVHHKDFKRENHSLDNLEVLCIRCHLEKHIETGQRPETHMEKTWRKWKDQGGANPFLRMPASTSN